MVMTGNNTAVLPVWGKQAGPAQRPDCTEARRCTTWVDAHKTIQYLQHSLPEETKMGAARVACHMIPAAATRSSLAATVNDLALAEPSSQA
jgi:hypothetical protein